VSAGEEKFYRVNIKDVLRRLWPTLRPHRYKFLVGIILILCTTGIEILTPVLIGRAVDAVTLYKSQHQLVWSAGLYLALITLKSLLDTCQAYVIQATGQGITHHLRCLLFSRIERLPVPYFDRNPTGRLLTRVINDIKSLSEMFTASISVLALDFMVISGTIIAMFWMDWKLAGVVLVTFPLVIFTIQFFGLRMALAYRKVRARLSEINAFLGENIGAVGTIQRLSAERERYEKFEHIVEAHQDAQMESVGLFALVQPVTNALNGVAMGTLLGLGGYWVIQGKLSVGVVVSFLAYLRNLFQPIRDLVEKYNTFLSAMVSAERVVNILDEKTESELGSEGRASGLIQLGGTDIRVADIEFDDVTFKYPTRDGVALQSVSFRLAAGTQLAVVGATGSGKSTLIRLLLRFYEPDRGEIRLGGRRLIDWDRFQLRKNIGVVHQEIYLFQGTVRENLTLGQTNFSDAHLIEQCRRAQLWDIIRERGGLDMNVYEGGTNFSIGERQLISFARVLVFDTPILVLDEATSSVDRLLERRLMEAIHETLSTRTAIVIAHRLTTIQECDDIVVLDQAHLVERGSYDGLLMQQGIFRKFHDIHSR
jgi:ATP-binding cassette subfamily B multidrug efflux pump